VGDEEYAPKHRGMPGVESVRRQRGPVLPGLLVACTLLAFIVLRNPSGTLRVLDEARGSSQSYAFVTTERNGDPVGWDPCSAIHFVVNPQGAPTGWQDTVDAAVRTVQRASDFRFVDDGTSSSRDFGRRTENDILIAWAGEAEVPKLEGNAAGIGGATPSRRAGRTTYVSGVVVLDAEEYDVMDRTGRLEAQIMILAHELGHVLGLDHVDDRRELMNPSYVGQSGFGNGDIRGLQHLHDLPCAPP
jgi:hypothetical protein